MKTFLSTAAALTVAVGIAAPSALAGPLQATSKLTGSAAYEQYGRSAAALGDVNGDGLGDVSVQHGGKTEVLFGTRAAAGLQLPSQGGAGFVIDGAGEGLSAGSAAGDVDQDGFGDIAIDGPAQSFVVYGSTSTQAVTLGASPTPGRVTVIVNQRTVDGDALRAAGDFNGDGYADLVRQRATDAAIVLGGPRVASIDARLTGPRIVPITGIQSCRWSYGIFYSCTTSLLPPVAVGDVNADGRADLFQPDRGFITLGRSGNAKISGAGPDSRSITLTGVTENLRERIQLAGAERYRPYTGRFGDLTGDGIDDLVLKRGQSFSYDRLQVIPGRATAGGITIDPATAPSFQVTLPTGVGEGAYAVQPAGDQSGDGRGDLAVTGYDRLRIVSLTGSAPQTVSVTGGLVPVPLKSAAGSWSDWLASASGAGDLDGDGAPDLIARMPQADSASAEDSGALYFVTHGPDRLAPELFPRGVTAPEEASTVSPATFAPAPGGSGTTFKLNLLEPADAELTFRRAAGGPVLSTERRSGLPAGRTDVLWNGLGRGIDGAPGDYVLELRAVDTAGNRSAPQSLPFTVRGGGVAETPTLTVRRRTVIPPGSIDPVRRDFTPVINGVCGQSVWAELPENQVVDVLLREPKEGDRCELGYSSPLVTSGYGDPPIPFELEDYPWRTTLSVNGAAPVDVTTGDRDQVKVPAFALRPGVNTVEFVDTWDDHWFTDPPTDRTGDVRWTFPKSPAGSTVGNAATSLGGTDLQLTPATANQLGVAVACVPGLDTGRMVVEFDAELTGGTGANGLTFAVFDREPTTLLTKNGNVGLGWVGYPGTAFALVTRKERYNPSENFVGIASGDPGKAEYPKWLETTSPGWPASSLILAGRTTHVRIQSIGGWVRMEIDGKYRVGQARVLPKDGCIGFTAATGPRFQKHAIRNLKVLRP